MDIQYFKSAWGDVKNSPGWFGKLCLLALVNFIPIFGQIVTFGYLYGWAREIAWGTHEPMPAKIFANEDGKFWRRGWFVLVLTFVFALVPSIIMNIGDSLQGLGVASTFFGQEYVASPGWLVAGSFVSFIGGLALLVASVLAWIGNMRIAIYDRLSAGFQLGKIWGMLRHDTGGILRIFGMELLVSLILGALLSIAVFVLVVLVAAVGVAGLVNAGYSLDMIQYMSSNQAARMALQFVASAGFIGVLAIIAAGFAAAMLVVFVDMLVVRALGYWTMQFDVPRWGGQDDPLPFELFEREQVRDQAHWQSQPQPEPQPGPQPYSAEAAAPGAAWQQGGAASLGVVAPIPAPAPDAPAANRVEPPATAIDYDEPIVVGAEFIMTPEEIDEYGEEMRARDAFAPNQTQFGASEVSPGIGEYNVRYEVAAPERPMSAAQGAHCVDDGQAGDPDIGEHGEPHVGESAGGQRQH